MPLRDADCVQWAFRLVLGALADHKTCDCDMDGMDPSPLQEVGHAVIGFSGSEWGLATYSALAVGLFWYGWSRAWLPRLLLAVPLFVRRQSAMPHPARDELREIIRTTPALSTKDLARQSGLNGGTVTYHLRMLERAGLVTSMRIGRKRAWFRTGAHPTDPEAAAAMTAPMRRSILELIRARPGMTGAELGRELRLSRATIHHHLQTLRAARLVDIRREGVHVRCFPPPAAVPMGTPAVMWSPVT